MLGDSPVERWLNQGWWAYCALLQVSHLLSHDDREYVREIGAVAVDRARHCQGSLPYVWQCHMVDGLLAKVGEIGYQTEG